MTTRGGRLVMIVVTALLLPAAACSRRTDVIASPCPAKRLAPSYLPPGARSSQRAKVVSDAEWWTSWDDGSAWIQVLGGISADRGDDTNTKRVTVRGHVALAGPVALQTGEEDVVDWHEPAPCDKQYAVVVHGLSGDEMLKIANSLQAAN